MQGRIFFNTLKILKMAWGLLPVGMGVSLVPGDSCSKKHRILSGKAEVAASHVLLAKLDEQVSARKGEVPCLRRIRN